MIEDETSDKCPYCLLDEEIYQIGRITVVKETISVDGKVYPYTYTQLNDSVCVLPVYQGKIHSIMRYRHAIRKWCLALSAGAIDSGETAEEAAKRDGLEETGLIVQQLHNLGRNYVSEGTSSASCKVFLAQCSEKVNQKLEPMERIKACEMTRDESEDVIRTNRFALTIGLIGRHRAREEGLI